MKSPGIKKSHPEASMAAIGNNLVALRKARGLTKAAVAYHANISMSTLNKLESGNCHSVGFLKLLALCTYYGVKPAAVVTEGYIKDAGHLPKIPKAK
jgi:transcriptional regulator with XRE-family HTH domain